MNIELRNNEKLVKKGAANHFMWIEGVGGKLFLTNQRIFFKSHGLNIQIHELSISLNEIENIEGEYSLWSIPNELIVKTRNGKREKFVVHSRSKWIEKIEPLVSIK